MVIDGTLALARSERVLSFELGLTLALDPGAIPGNNP